MMLNFNVKIGVGGSYFTIQICISNDITLWERRTNLFKRVKINPALIYMVANENLGFFNHLCT